MPDSAPTYTDSPLRAWSLRGREADFERAYRALYPKLLGYARTVSGAGAGCEDAVQEVLLWAYDHRERLARVDHPESYLYVALGNNLRTGLKRAARRREIIRQLRDAGDFPDSAPAADAADGTHADALLAELKRVLPARQLEVIYLRFYGEKSFKEVAEIMGLSPQVCQNYAMRGIRKLRERGRASLMGHLARVAAMAIGISCALAALSG